MPARKNEPTSDTPKKRTPAKKKAPVEAPVSAMDESVMAALMLQLQSLVTEVTALREEVVDLRAEKSPLPSKFSQVLDEMEKGVEEDVSAEVSRDESEELLARLDEINSSLEDLSSGSEEINQGELDSLLSSALEGAAEYEEVEEEFDPEEMERLLNSTSSVPETGKSAEIDSDELAAALSAMSSPVEEHLDFEESEQLEAAFEVGEEPSSSELDSHVESADSGGNMSDDEIAAMLAAAQSEDSAPVATPTAPVESADSGGNMSDDDIAAMLAAAQGGEPEAVETGEDEDLTEEQLAELIRGEISRQDEELEAIMSAPTPAAQESKNEPAVDSTVLSADEIAKLMAEPDPDEATVPATSKAMDEDELAALLAEVGPKLDAPIPTADDLPVVEESVSEEVQEEAESPKVVSRPVRSGTKPDTGAIKAVPAQFAIRAMALPMRFEDGKLVCHVAEPVDQTALDRLSKAIGMGVVTVPVNISEVVLGLREAYAEVRDDHARSLIRHESEIKPTILDTVKSIMRKIA